MTMLWGCKGGDGREPQEKEKTKDLLLGICCSHTATAAALEQGSRGAVKKRGQRSSLAPGNATLNHLIPPILNS